MRGDMPGFNGAPVSRLPPAAGSVFVPGPASSVTITFPPGRFAVPPMVTATCTATANTAIIANIAATTASGCIAYLYPAGMLAWASGAISVFWIAMDAG